MTITIHAGHDTSYIMLETKNTEFVKKWGDKVKVSTNDVYKELEKISNWANNELGEECLFEID